MILNDQRNGKHGICVKEYIDANICFLLQFLNGVSVSNCRISVCFLTVPAKYPLLLTLTLLLRENVEKTRAYLQKKQ